MSDPHTEPDTTAGVGTFTPPPDNEPDDEPDTQEKDQ